MTSLRAIGVLAAAASAALVSGSALAQRQPPTPEQRLERLERQVQQMQRQVFPRGRPADTAGFSDEPAATQTSVITLDQRLDALERQMSDILRQSEENGNRLRTIDADLARLRSEQEQRIAGLEQRIAEAAAAAAAVPAATTPATTIEPPRPRPGAASASSPASSAGGTATTVPAVDAAEEAYSAGFKLWEAGEHDQAIAALRAFASEHPRHRRVSYANNLIGRAQLDKGDARAAAATLLNNYRSNPKGERAADSLYYLGQALMKLGQPGQACKAYAELEAVYGAKVRADLKKLIAEGKTQAQCG